MTDWLADCWYKPLVCNRSLLLTPTSSSKNEHAGTDGDCYELVTCFVGCNLRLFWARLRNKSKL